MSDQRLRELERVWRAKGDSASGLALARARLRLGEGLSSLTPELGSLVLKARRSEGNLSLGSLRLAARFALPAARLALSEAERLKLSPSFRWSDALVGLRPPLCVRVAWVAGEALASQAGADAQHLVRATLSAAAACLDDPTPANAAAARASVQALRELEHASAETLQARREGSGRVLRPGDTGLRDDAAAFRAAEAAAESARSLAPPARGLLARLERAIGFRLEEPLAPLRGAELALEATREGLGERRGPAALREAFVAWVLR